MEGAQDNNRRRWRYCRRALTRPSAGARNGESHHREVLRIEARLWEDELQFISVLEAQKRTSFWANADPVDASPRINCAIGLDRDLKPQGVNGFKKRRV